MPPLAVCGRREQMVIDIYSRFLYNARMMQFGDICGSAMQRLNGYLYSKKARLIVFCTMLGVLLFIFVPCVMSVDYRAHVIHAVEKIVMHRPLRRADKWDNVLRLGSIKGIVFVPLIIALCQAWVYNKEQEGSRENSKCLSIDAAMMGIVAIFACVTTFLSKTRKGTVGAMTFRNT